LGVTVRTKFAARFLCLCLLAGLAVNGPVMAEDAESRAGEAVVNILLEYDADEFASYSIRDSGFVDIEFARNTPDALYGKIVDKLRSHPDIKGVLPGKGGPVCSRF